ncbi:transmembrane channel-like protein 7 [Xenia sp. Carnegie-2017]|uniref:transmembrane channel-like protein 7 n=1 Tax=Xenia sp. Carnegie-2017 TaxID=2897299 RepID=UPI001F0428A3|nr:transmembrane channel-like protein 7 [Xenia sp. Carnegie-2017]
MEDKHIEDLSLNLKNNTGTNESESEAVMSSGGQHDNQVYATTSGLSNPAYVSSMDDLTSSVINSYNQTVSSSDDVIVTDINDENDVTGEDNGVMMDDGNDIREEANGVTMADLTDGNDVIEEDNGVMITSVNVGNDVIEEANGVMMAGVNDVIEEDNGVMMTTVNDANDVIEEDNGVMMAGVNDGNPVIGDDVMMTDMIYENADVERDMMDGHGYSRIDDDVHSIASTDTYRSTTSNKDEDTQNLERILPSHTVRAIRNLPSNEERRRFYQGRTPDGSLRRRGHAQSVVNTSEFILAGEERGVQQTENIKLLATSLKRKKAVLNEVNQKQKEEKHISAFRYFRLRVAASWQRFRKNVATAIKDHELWIEPLKKIQGKFGTGVLSYFVFLRWLFFLNILIFLLVLLFIFVPQIIHERSTDTANSTDFNGKNLLDGAGWFNTTELYYGQYTNKTIEVADGYYYQMPLAYLLTCASYFLLCLIIMASSMASYYEKYYLRGANETDDLPLKILNAWDYNINDKEGCSIKQQSIAKDIEETLAATKTEGRDLNRSQSCNLIILRLFTNFLSLSLIGAATYVIVEVVSGISIEDDANLLKELLLPLSVSFLNLLLPAMFRIIASFENYQNGETAINVSLARTVLLKVCTLAGIFVSLYRDIGCASEKEKKKCVIFYCWENYVGQTFYRLVWVDFAFILLATFLGEFVRRLLANNIQWWRKNIGFPGFDISRNVLDLIYAQSLCWFGTFFSPLLSFICLFKLWILFYVKKTSVLRNCRPSVRPFLASKMNIIFLGLLAVSYALILISFGYAITSESRFGPSNCGPFRNRETIYQVVLDNIDDFPKVLKEIIRIVSSPFVVFFIFIVLSLLTYYYKLLKSSNEQKIKLFLEQIALVGRDKNYLMAKINKNVATRAQQQVL